MSNYSSQKTDGIQQVVLRSQAGVFKRIDENRELLELLQSEAKDPLKKSPWVIGWLKSQDKFLTDLAEKVDAQNADTWPCPQGHFPRPWPGEGRN